MAPKSSTCLVVGYDRSESARQAAQWAARELPAGGRLVIVHSCRALHAPASPLSSAKERRELGRALIDELLLEGEDELFDVEFETEVSEEDPVRALTEAAGRHGAQAIVIGSEHHSWLHKAAGTVMTELLETSPVPVIAVPAGAAAADSQSPGATPGGGVARPPRRNRPQRRSRTPVSGASPLR